MSFNNTNTDILLAGAFAALSVDILVYPLDTIKTRFQSTSYKKLYTNEVNGTLNRSLFRGLYQGIGSVVLATVPSSGAFFTTYEGAKSLLHRTNPTLSSGGHLIPTPIVHSAASCAGELVSCFILTPAEVLKQNAQVINKSANSTTTVFDANATRQALKKFKKPSQLWRGYTALVARNLPFTAMQFPMFEHMKRSILEYRKGQDMYRGTLLERGIVTAVSAGCAGSIAAVITTPVDVVKTRIMLSASSENRGFSETGKSATQPSEATTETKNQLLSKKSTIEAARQAAREGRAGGIAVGREILKSEGITGLFRGATLRGAWTALGSGLYLGVYETGRSYLENRRAEGNDGGAIV